MYAAFAVCCPEVTYGIRKEKIGIPTKALTDELGVGSAKGIMA